MHNADYEKACVNRLLSLRVIAVSVQENHNNFL
jgi:hypothetical protein